MTLVMSAPQDEPLERQHGFCLSAEDERLLRGPIPEAALRWAASAVSAARVLDATPLAGGTSSAVHALSVEDANGHVHELVLRRFVREDWLAEEPDLAAREAMALSLAADSPLPTPSLVGVDLDGADAGAPAVLMTRLPGRVVWDRRSLTGS
jgi:aminoglycoside phosphotransferase (APT) family kinase protein